MTSSNYSMYKKFTVILHQTFLSNTNINIYLTHRCDPNRYYHSSQSWHESNENDSGSSHFPDRQNWSLTIRCSLVSKQKFFFLVIFFWGGVWPLSIYHIPPTGWLCYVWYKARNIVNPMRILLVIISSHYKRNAPYFIILCHNVSSGYLWYSNRVWNLPLMTHNFQLSNRYQTSRRLAKCRLTGRRGCTTGFNHVKKKNAPTDIHRYLLMFTGTKNMEGQVPMIRSGSWAIPSFHSRSHSWHGLSSEINMLLLAASTR